MAAMWYLRAMRQTWCQGIATALIDVFIKDIQTGAIRRVSTDALGAGGNAASTSARISADGHFVTFASAATNLVPGDTNYRTDIFIKDLLTGEIQLLTGNAAGTQALGDSYRPDLTSDGRKIVYESWASNLVSGDSNNAGDVFLVTNTLGLPSTGFDRVLASTSYTLPDAVESLQLTGSLAINGTGNALDNTLVGNAGANRLTGGAGNDTLDGGAGLDTAVFSGSKAGYTLTRTSSGMTAASAADGTDALINIERLQFTDKTLAFDLDGNAGQAYRLYQAAFDRVPDQGGLGYWIDQMDSGTGLSQVATGFINSAEFKALYGNNPSNAEFVTLLYDNVLHRAPDAGGYDFWMNELSHGVSREQVLTGFSESTENKVALMAFDMDGNMGKDYRLYQAAFDRQPDVSGLDYWYHQMNSGVTLQQVASGFINSAEFKALYGNNPSNAEFVTLLYDNVLHRAPDTGGFNFWMNDLDQGTSREHTDGLIYGAGWNGTIYKFDSSGAILGSLQVAQNLSDIDISAQGELITADWCRNVYTTSTDLAGYSSFSVTVGNASTMHVAFTDAAPEPTPPAAGPSILCASTNAAGAPANGNSFNPAISADGRYVAFESDATNLVAGDGNGARDIFVKDLQTGAIWCASTNAQGVFGNGVSSSPDITADGRYVVFESDAPNLVPGDTNGAIDVFIKDIQTGAIRRASTDALGAGGNAASTSARISADGHFVTFESAATNLVPGDTNYRTDIFIKDLLTGEIQLLTGNAAGTQALEDSYRPDLTSDGRKIVYESWASNLVSGDSNNASDVFLVTNTLGLPSTGFDRVLASTSYTLPDAVESLQLTGSLAINGTGNALDNTLVGNAGANRLTGGAGNDTLDGGAGLDSAVFSGSKAGYTLTRTSSGMTAASAADGTDALINIERLQFTDKTLAFDLDGNAGQAYRLYQAAFDRVPDQGGLGYWIDQMDSGTGLSQVATGFINSAEFKALYGNNPSNAEFVTLLYDNVLHRAPDTGGYDFWMNELSHGVSREQVLTGFSESTENKVALMAFDMDGNMGKDYRLYQAAFDRQPDVSGLDYWYHQMNSGVTLQQVASGFINSAEFKALYGNNPSNAEFVTLLVRQRASSGTGYRRFQLLDERP